MKMTKTLKTQTGFTLVELMVVTGLLSVILMGVYSVTAYSQAIFLDGHSYARLTQSSTQTLRTLSREIGQTSPNAAPSHLNITTDGNGNSVVAFQIPVDWDNDGDAISGSLTPIVEWGAYDSPGQLQDGRLNDWTAYYVNDDNQLVREIRNAAAGTAYANTEQVVSNDVQLFQVTKNGDNLSMLLTVQLTDTVGNHGTSKVHTQTFQSNTLLRNAVD